MDKLVYNTKDSGFRIKMAAKNKGLKNNDIAEILGYSSGKQISPIYQGKQALRKDQIEALSNALGFREEYLLCKDDYPTYASMIEKQAALENKHSLQITSLLSLFGYTTKPNFNADYYEISKDYNVIGTLTKDDYDILMNDIHAFSNFFMNDYLPGKIKEYESKRKTKE